MGNDQVPVDQAGQYSGPYDMQMALAGGQTEVVGAGAVVPVLGGTPTTELWAVVYDIDDNNQVDFGDLAMFAPAFGRTVGAPDAEPPYIWWADFDKTGQVDFGDLAFFAPNFGKTRSAVQAGTQTLVFPTNFPERLASGASRTGRRGGSVRRRRGARTVFRRRSLHSRSDSSVAAPAERAQRWSDRWEPLEDLLSLLADQPSDRLLDLHEALFAQAGG